MASARQCRHTKSHARVVSQMTVKGRWLKSIALSPPSQGVAAFHDGKLTGKGCRVFPDRRDKVGRQNDDGGVMDDGAPSHHERETLGIRGSGEVASIGRAVAV
jgi:hypothetical protein